MAGNVLLEYLVARNVIGLAVIFWGATLLYRALTSKPSYPPFPWEGEGKGTWAWVKGNFTYIPKYREWVQQGYTKYTKNALPFIIPGTAMRHTLIVLPESQASWMLDQPDHILSAAAAQSEELHGRYSFLGAHYIDNPYHGRVIHKRIARHLSALIPGMEEEIQRAVDLLFGMDTDNWKKINVWDSLFKIVPFITNRMVVGYPLCRNTEFLRSCVDFTEDVIRNMFLIGLLPRFLRPTFGPIIGLPNWWHWNKASKFSLPLIKQRLHDMERKAAGDADYDNWAEPEDFITWTIRVAKEDGNESELQAEVISKRIMAVEFAATHTASLTGHGVILDLLSSDPSKGYIEGIREEAARILREDGGHWTKTGLARMFRLDSAIRESMRVSNIAQTLVERKVIAREGITHSKEGWHVPYGKFLALNLAGVHHDEDIYSNASTYDAFRFSREREEYHAKVQGEKDSDEGLRLKNLSLVTTSLSYLTFGHGRHACPGRFFVALELKMLVAYLLLNYDVKMLKERPKTGWLGALSVPPFKACVEIKRRKKPVRG